MLANVAVDAVFDSVSVATTYKEKLKKQGVIFCSFTEAVRDYPELIKKYLGSVVPANDNLLRGVELGGVLGRLVLFHSERRSLSDGAVDLFPHQQRRSRGSSSGR